MWWAAPPGPRSPMLRVLRPLRCGPSEGRSERSGVQTADPCVCRRRTFVNSHRDSDANIRTNVGSHAAGNWRAAAKYILAMSLAVRLLGTSASRPTVERNVASIALVREGETLMFDCGEGTQRQMMRYGVSFALADIFFTHMHTDHVLGVIGLTRTLQLQGRTEPLRLWGPKGSGRVLRQWSGFGGERLGYAVEIFE